MDNIPYYTKDEIKKNLTKLPSCNKCELCQNRTQVVQGQGNIKSKIIFIGEAPGKSEDEQGIPFCGRSGKFLTELLNSINLERKDVYITNIVKCRPPENRDPSEKEKQICSIYLKSEIGIIQPKLIVTLGRHSMYDFLPKNYKISEIHGKLQIYNNLNILPLYHPAVALYNPNSKIILQEDFKKIPEIITKLK